MSPLRRHNQAGWLVLVVLGLLLPLILPAFAHAARSYITIVGSSTVYPFTVTVAEQFGHTTRFRTPKIESTGTGGGMKLFCEGIDLYTPDIADASRRITGSEMASCRKNGVTEITEIKIGYDGIVIANSRKAPVIHLTRRQLYLALARQVPSPDGNGRFIINPYKTWHDIDPSLPDKPITIFGPPPTSGTRDAFDELAMTAGCRTFPAIRALETTDENRFREVCQTMREDGAYIDAGENDNLIVQKLELSHHSLGIFGYSFLDQNSDKIQGALINGIPPGVATIATGTYALSRPLFLYVKNAHVGIVPGIREFVAEYTSARAWGQQGYLLEKGLIPATQSEQDHYTAIARALTPMQIP